MCVRVHQAQLKSQVCSDCCDAFGKRKSQKNRMLEWRTLSAHVPHCMVAKHPKEQDALEPREKLGCADLETDFKLASTDAERTRIMDLIGIVCRRAQAFHAKVIQAVRTKRNVASPPYSLQRGRR